MLRALTSQQKGESLRLGDFSGNPLLGCNHLQASHDHSWDQDDRKQTFSDQQLKKGVFGKGSFRNLCAELCFVFFCVLRWFSPANLTEISFGNCHAGIFWKTPSRKTPKRSCWSEQNSSCNKISQIAWCGPISGCHAWFFGRTVRWGKPQIITSRSFLRFFLHSDLVRKGAEERKFRPEFCSENPLNFPEIFEDCLFFGPEECMD